MTEKIVKTSDVLATFDRIAGEIQGTEERGESMLTGEVRKALEGWLDLTPETAAEPVRHGHWIDGVYNRCSICGKEMYPTWDFTKTPYCPYCGAKMDGEAKNDD